MPPSCHWLPTLPPATPGLLWRHYTVSHKDIVTRFLSRVVLQRFWWFDVAPRTRTTITLMSTSICWGPLAGSSRKTFSPTVATVVLWLWWDIPQLSRIVVGKVEVDPTWGKLGWNVQIIAWFLSPKNLLRSTRGENGQNLASWEIEYLIRVSIFISLHHPRSAM